MGSRLTPEHLLARRAPIATVLLLLAVVGSARAEQTPLSIPLERAGFEILSPGAHYRSAETLVRLSEPARASAFLLERAIHVSPKPEGVRIATHFYNDEGDVDACVDALVAYRECSED